jgi:hypothetical protein
MTDRRRCATRSNECVLFSVVASSSDQDLVSGYAAAADAATQQAFAAEIVRRILPTIQQKLARVSERFIADEVQQTMVLRTLEWASNPEATVKVSLAAKVGFETPKALIAEYCWRKRPDPEIARRVFPDTEFSPQSYAPDFHVRARSAENAARKVAAGVGKHGAETFEKLLDSADEGRSATRTPNAERARRAQLRKRLRAHTELYLD